MALPVSATALPAAIQTNTTWAKTARIDTWSFAGGGRDLDETPEQCIVREMKEELDVNVAIKPIGDEPVWGMTDDDVDDKL